MSIYRSDATGRILQEPGPCVCNTGVGGAKSSCERIGWHETPHGPRAFLVDCNKGDGGGGGATMSRLDAAYARAEEEVRELAKEGPPSGALVRGGRVNRGGGAVSSDAGGGSRLERAYARADAEARAASKDGPPEGAVTRRK